jgi:hypothetical protein
MQPTPHAKPPASVVRTHRILGCLAVLYSALLLGVLGGVNTGALIPSGLPAWPVWLEYLWVGAASLWPVWPIVLVLHAGRSTLRIVVPTFVAIVLLLPCVRPYESMAWWVFVGSREADQRFTTKVDWYKPPPKGWEFPAGVHIPSGLIIGVPPPFHDEAIALLGDADVVELTWERAEHFAPGAAPDDALQSGINQKMEWDRRLAHLTDWSGWNRRALKTIQTERQRSIERDNLEIKQLQEWEHRLSHS